jgi:hypothetical protein
MTEQFDSGLLAGMLQKQGVDPAVVAMMNNNGGFGGNNAWIVIFFILLMGRGGFGGLNGTGLEDIAKNSTVINESNYTRLLDAISTQGTRQEVAIGDLANSLGASIGDVKTALASVDKAIALSNGDLKSAVQSCCCNIRQEILSTSNATNLAMTNQHADTVNQIQQTRYLIQAQGSAQDAMIAQKFADQNAYLAEQFCQIKSREDGRQITDLQQKLADAKAAANTQAIIAAVSAKDTLAVSGTVSTTAGTWTGTGSLT